MTENLQKLFGETGLLKILNSLDNSDKSLTKAEIAERAGVAESTVHRNWGTIQELGLVKEPMFQRYSLDYSDEVVDCLFELEAIINERFFK